MKDKVILFDADSLIYQAIYKVVTFAEIRGLLLKGESRFLVEQEILQRGYDRFEKMAFDIFNEIEQEYNITEIKYFFTNCKRNFRKDIDSEYKANRKRNKWVSELRKYLIDYMEGSYASDEYEADDLIYFNSQLYEVNDYIICSIDKDLKQIEGLHFDYYQLKIKDENGDYLMDEFGKEVKKRKGFINVSKENAENLLWEMMLIGDTSDNIKGVKGIGKVKAGKLLAERTKWGKLRVLCEQYKQESDNWKERIRINDKLIRFQ
jgi:DNA polymerase-1